MTTTPNPPDWRGLCEELVEEVIARPLILDRALIDRARAALAQPKPEVEELVAWLRDHAYVLNPSARSKARQICELLERQPAPVPVAWMYRGEPDFDGKKWRDNWRVTLDQRLAEFEAKPDNPIPLFRAQPAPAPVAVSERPPLWRYMQAARHNRPLAADSASAEANAPLYAAEIRALRDWLVPEEPPPHRGMRPGGTNLTYQETLSVERQRLRALLTAEAARAERGGET